MAEVLAINDDFSGALSGTNWSTTTGWTTSGGLALNSAGNSAQPLVFNNTTLADSNTSSNHRKIIADFTAIHADSGIQLGLTGATTQGFFGLKSVNGNLMWVAYLPDYTSRGPGQTINDTAKYVLENYAECPAVVPGTDAIITSGAAATLTVIVRYSDYNAGEYRSNDVSFYVNSVRVLQFRLEDFSFSSTNGGKIKNGYFALVSGNSSTRVTSAQGYTYTGTTSYTFLEDDFNRSNTTGYIAANASPTSPTGRVLSSSDGTTSGRGTNMNISTNRLSITGNTTRQRILNKAATPPTNSTYFEYDYISGRLDFGLGSNAVEWPAATGPNTDGYIFTQTSTSLQIQTWGKSTLINTSTYSVTVSSGARVRIYVDAGGPKFFVNSTVYTGIDGSGGYFEWAAILSDGPGFWMWSESGGGVIDNLKVYWEQAAAVPPALLGSFPGTIYHGFPQIEQGFI
jgi:hypothetical protein